MSIFSGAEVLLCFDEIAVHLGRTPKRMMPNRQLGWTLGSTKIFGNGLHIWLFQHGTIAFRRFFFLDQGRCEFSQLHIDIPGRSCAKSFHSKGYAILKGWEKKLQIISKSRGFHRFWDD